LSPPGRGVGHAWRVPGVQHNLLAWTRKPAAPSARPPRSAHRGTAGPWQALAVDRHGSGRRPGSSRPPSPGPPSRRLATWNRPWVPEFPFREPRTRGRHARGKPGQRKRPAWPTSQCSADSDHGSSRVDRRAGQAMTVAPAEARRGWAIHPGCQLTRCARRRTVAARRAIPAAHQAMSPASSRESGHLPRLCRGGGETQIHRRGGLLLGSSVWSQLAVAISGHREPTARSGRSGTARYRRSPAIARTVVNFPLVLAPGENVLRQSRGRPPGNAVERSLVRGVEIDQPAGRDRERRNRLRHPVFCHRHPRRGPSILCVRAADDHPSRRRRAGRPGSDPVRSGYRRLAPPQADSRWTVGDPGTCGQR
jgi:hypothetical protein